MNPDSWAGIKHAESIARRKAALIEREKDLQRSRDSFNAVKDRADQQAAERMEARCTNRDLADTAEVREIILTELNSDSPLSSLARQTEDELGRIRHELETEIADLQNQLEIRRHEVGLGILRLHRLNESNVAWKSAGAGTSKKVVAAAAVAVGTLEAGLTVPAANNIAQRMVPSIAHPTLFTLPACGVLSAASLVLMVYAGRVVRNYTDANQQSKNLMKATKSNPSLGRAEELINAPSSSRATIAATAAAALQVAMAFVRVLIDTGDSSVGTLYMMISIVTALLACGVGFLEYTAHVPDSGTNRESDEALVNGFLSGSRLVQHELPMQLRDTEVLLEKHRLDRLHELQPGVVLLKHPEVMRVLNELTATARTNIESLNNKSFEYTPPSLIELADEAKPIQHGTAGTAAA